MSKIDRLLGRLADEKDRELLRSPSKLARLKLLARIALRYRWVYFSVLALTFLYMSASGMDVYHRTEAPQFCGLCHEMGANFQSWQTSTHGGVRCIDCHAKPGFAGYAAAKIGGMRQLATHLSAENIGEIRIGDHDREIVSENCARCHAGASRLDERDGIRVSHQVHIERGVKCIECHGRSFAHPDPGEPRPAGPMLASAKPAAAQERDLAGHGDCFGCHDGTREVGGEVAFDAKAEESCARCHPDSVAVWDHGKDPWKEEDRRCLSCHDPGAKAGHFSLKGENEAAVCKTCHETVVTAKHASTHEPYEKGQCHECHRVMSPAHTFGTGPKPVVQFCLSCHEQVANLLASKPTAKPARFVLGKKDLHRRHAKLLEGPELCRDCHAGHGSAAGRAMIQMRNEAGEPDGSFEARDRGGACTGECHEDPAEYEWPEGVVLGGNP